MPVFNRHKNQMEQEVLLKMLFDTHKEKVYKLAYSILRNEHDAKDVVQDTFITVYEKFHQLRDKDKLSSWICTIAWNIARAKYNRKKRETLFDNEQVIPFTIFTLTESSSPEQFYLDKESRDYLIHLISDLGEKHAEILQLYYFADLSYEEIAYQLNISIGTVKSRLSRAREYLREILEESERVYEQIHFRKEVKS